MSVRMYGGSPLSNSRTYGRNYSTHGASAPRDRITTTKLGSDSRSTAARATITRPLNSSSTGSSTFSRTSRQLPEGPGPLPNQYSHDRHSSSVQYVTREQRQRHSSNYSTTKPSYDRENTRRKPTTDLGYDSGTSSKTRTGYSSSSSSGINSTLAGRRSKSYSNINSSFTELSINDDHAAGKYNVSLSPLKGSSPSSYKSGDYGQGAYKSNGLSSSSRTKTLGSLPKAGDSSSYHMQSTSHSDYRSPYRDSSDRYKSTSNATSSPESPPSLRGTSPSAKKSSFILDHNENRREPITASPRSLRKYSTSSSSISPTSPPNSHGSSDGLVGLRNLGNTCFMNSILQCLSSTSLLTDQLLKGTYRDSINSKSSMKGKLIQAFADLIKSMWKASQSETAISPHSFKTQIQRFAPRFVGYNQQDAQEFLHFLLEGLHDDLNHVQEKPKYKICEFESSMSEREKAAKSWKHYLARDDSLITDIFVGLLKSTLKCTECGYKSDTFDPFWDLSLPIPRKSSYSRSSSLDGDVNIRDCMELFTKEEILDGDERPTCEKCKKKRKSTKKFTVQRFPRILVIHLKRFSGYGFRSKLQTNVDFPVTGTQDLSEFASDPSESRALYNLYSVSNHSGTTYGGHYTAYCKHPSSQQWHCFSDSRVETMTTSRVRGSQAYILFYEKLQDRQSSL